MWIQTRFIVAVATFFLSASVGQCFAQAVTSYWIAKVDSNGKLMSFDYSIKVPDYFVPWLLKKTDRGGGAEIVKEINGRNFTFVRQYFSYDVVNNPRDGKIRIDNHLERWKSSDWQFDERMKTDTTFTARLHSLQNRTEKRPQDGLKSICWR